MEKQKHIVEIIYSDTGKKEVETFHTDDTHTGNITLVKHYTLMQHIQTISSP